MKPIGLIIIALAAMLVLMADSVCIADPKIDAIHTRLEQRYPQIRAAKDAGKIGETYLGMVEAVDAKFLDDSAIKQLIDDENGDRGQLYELIAGDAGTTPDVVAQRAGVHNFDLAHLGDYLKYQDGGWKRK